MTDAAATDLHSQPAAVVIGASAGALGALSVILPALPRDFALPVLVVVHMPADRKNLMVDLLQAKCAVKICEADDKEQLAPGCVYLAPPDYHLLVEPTLEISLSSEEPIQFSRPSIDVLFETAADAFGSGLIGVVLTGANDDGAKGLRQILNEGGQALVQKPETAYSRPMPEAALRKCPEALALTLEEIADYLRKAGER
ncbi:MAG TPA: chemotaxis protein CheB [Patescibacteria group bacterium]|nr:chemotaxis protein CheB [Patescibacteria group bacterium]